MNRRVARLLISLYPRRWQDRYGTEFELLLQSSRADSRALADVIWSALREHLSPTQGRKMNRTLNSFTRIAKQPGAFLPLTMSLSALALVLAHIALYGLSRETDEGVTAHLWQLLMAGQMPVVAFFAIRWLPQAPKQTLGVLAVQASAGLLSVAAVFFLHLG